MRHIDLYRYGHATKLAHECFIIMNGGRGWRLRLNMRTTGAYSSGCILHEPRARAAIRPPVIAIFLTASHPVMRHIDLYRYGHATKLAHGCYIIMNGGRGWRLRLNMRTTGAYSSECVLHEPRARAAIRPPLIEYEAIRFILRTSVVLAVAWNRALAIPLMDANAAYGRTATAGTIVPECRASMQAVHVPGNAFGWSLFPT